jgi:arabinosyltransferase C
LPRFVLAVVAAVLAVAFALLPVERQTAEYLWEAEQHGPQVPLLLIERTPDQLELTFPCEAVTAADDGERLFASSRRPGAVPALLVRRDGDRVVADVPAEPAEPEGQRTALALDLEPADGCEVGVAFDRSASRLALTADGQQSSTAVAEDAFELTGFHWSGALEDARARLATTPFSMARNSLAQQAAAGFILLLFLASLVLLYRNGWRWRPRVAQWRPAPSEWLMLAVASLVATVDLPRVDDGRILARARNLAGFDFRADVPVLVENTILPQRWVYEWVLGSTVASSHLVPVIRGLSVLLMVGAWMLLRRRVLPRLLGQRLVPSVRFVAWTVFAVFAVAWTATLRPEPLLVLLIVVVLATIASWPEQPRAWPYATVIAAVGLAIATHVAGLAAAFAAIPVLVWGVRDLRHSALPVLTGAAWGGVASVLVMFPGSNLRQHYLAATHFQDTGVHGRGPLETWIYLDGIQASTAPMMLATGLAVLGGAVVAGSMMRRLLGGGLDPAQALVVGTALSPLGLMFTPSKWLWHLAVLAPVAVVGWVLLARAVHRRHPRSPAPLLLAATACALLTAWSLAPAWSPRVLTRWWNQVALREVTADAWGARLPWLVGEGVRWWAWAMAFAVAALLARWVLRRRRAGDADAWVVGGLVGAGLMAVSVVQLSLPVADAVASGARWTFVGQSVGGLLGSELGCGVPAATDLGTREGPGAADAGADTAIAGHSLVHVFAPCLESPVQRDGAWQVPSLLMGDLSHDQRRFLVEYDATRLGCNSFPRPRAGDSLCFSTLGAEADPLPPSSITWSTSVGD